MCWNCATTYSSLSWRDAELCLGFLSSSRVFHGFKGEEKPLLQLVEVSGKDWLLVFQSRQPDSQCWEYTSAELPWGLEGSWDKELPGPGESLHLGKGKGQSMKAKGYQSFLSESAQDFHPLSPLCVYLARSLLVFEGLRLKPSFTCFQY